MILVDTNVLIALAVDGRDSQREEALAQLSQLGAEAGPALVTESVLIEACWVLERSYRHRRLEVAEAMRSLVSTPPLRAWDPSLADTALALMARRPTFSVTDCLLLARAAETGSPVMTFGTRLQREARQNT